MGKGARKLWFVKSMVVLGGEEALKMSVEIFLVWKGLCGHDFPGKGRLDQILSCFTALVMR